MIIYLDMNKNKISLISTKTYKVSKHYNKIHENVYQFPYIYSKNIQNSKHHNKMHEKVYKLSIRLQNIKIKYKHMQKLLK